jgi:DNA-directed RNA polymerase specialized sigma24 family protein
MDEHETSVSQCIESVQNGDSEAFERLANIFLPAAIQNARNATTGAPNQFESEEIANSALKSLCIGIRNGKISFQGDKQLFALLKQIVVRKVKRLWKYYLADKRGIRQKVDPSNNSGFELPLLDLCKATNGNSVFVSDRSICLDANEQMIAEQVLSMLAPELKGLFTELVMSLDEHPRRALLLLLNEDLTDAELARKLGRAVSSAERYKKLIRDTLSDLASKS